LKIDSVGIIGGGAWGTALAQAMRRAGREVILWAREPEAVEEINARHLNSLFLPGVPLDPAIRATGTLADVCRSDVVLMVAPSGERRGWTRAWALQNGAFADGSARRHGAPRSFARWWNSADSSSPRV